MISNNMYVQKLNAFTMSLLSLINTFFTQSTNLHRIIYTHLLS